MELYFFWDLQKANSYKFTCAGAGGDINPLVSRGMVGILRLAAITSSMLFPEGVLPSELYLRDIGHGSSRNGSTFPLYFCLMH